MKASSATLALTLFAVVAALAPQSAAAATILEPVGNYSQPVYVTSDPDDPDRLFIVERDGRIQLTEGGGTTTFLDIEPLVLSPPEAGSTGDHGMYSVAFSPDYATDHLFYVAYSSADDPATEGEDESGEWHISEFETDGDSVDPESRREVLTIEYPAARLHYAGQLQFGPDGYLYATTGDGGPQGDPDGNAQDLGGLLGKILRIDPQGSVPGQYSIPADNPFAGATPGADEIWSYGLRNPWRFSFDRDTGDLVVGDVGHQGWEEINYRPQIDGGGRGDNFGWNCREAFVAFSSSAECAEAAEAGLFTDPVFAYPNSGQPECAVTGGYVVRDSSVPDLDGRYVYGDLCTGEIRSIALGVPLAQDDRSEGLSVPGFLVSFGEDACGRIYVVSLAGAVSRLVGDGESDCEEGPAEEPPVEEPPPEEPPAEQPPAEQPPVEEPPAADRPTGHAPAGEAPVAEEPPADGPGDEPSDAEPPAPSSNFHFIAVNRMPRKGRAWLVIGVSTAGTVRLLGTRRVRRAGPRTVGAPGRVRLLVRPKGRARRKLNRLSRSDGRARIRVSARVSFAPEDGERRIKTRRLRVVKRR